MKRHLTFSSSTAERITRSPPTPSHSFVSTAIATHSLSNHPHQLFPLASPPSILVIQYTIIHLNLPLQLHSFLIHHIFPLHSLPLLLHPSPSPSSLIPSPRYTSSTRQVSVQSTVRINFGLFSPKFKSSFCCREMSTV